MAEAKLKEYKMMVGSTGGADYLPFAKKGNVLLGIKPIGAVSGSKSGVPGTTYFAARLRSAPNNGLIEDKKTGNVVKFQKEPDDVASAWPDVTWDKVAKDRASTIIGSFMKGTLTDDPETLLANIGEGKLADQMAQYLVDLAGRPNLIMKKAELAEWINAQYQPAIDKTLHAIEQAKKVQEAFASTVGTFGMQAAIMKKVYEETTDQEAADDLDEGNVEVDVEDENDSED